MMHRMNLLRAILVLICGLLAVPAFAAAGKFQFVSGAVRVANASGERVAAKGMEVEEGDRITSGSPAMAQIRMSDGGVIVIRPNTRFVVKAFRFSGKEDGTERAHFVLEKGSVRAVTGTIGTTNKQNYLIQTPNASIGVRGTDHEPFVIEPGDPLGKAGTYDKVNVGATVLENAGGALQVAAGAVGYAADANTAPVMLLELPGFYGASAGNVQMVKRASQASRRGGSSSGGSSPDGASASSAGVNKPLRTVDGLNLSAALEPLPVEPSTERTAAVASYTLIDTGDIVAKVKAPLTFDVANAQRFDTPTDRQPFDIDWGRWRGLIEVGAGEVQNLHFAHSPQLTTEAQLSQIKLGSEALYTLQGGSRPTNQLGVAGALNKLEVGVDFAKNQITRYTVELTMPPIAATGPNTEWRANGSGSMDSFKSDTGIVLRVQCHNCLPNSLGIGSGNAKGAFVGPNAEHLLTGYTLQVRREFSATGAAALTR